MPTITIDNQTIDVPPDTTVLQAARQLGIDIPALCQLDGYPPNTSCMCCIVKIEGRTGLVPSCATTVTNNMIVHSQTDEVITARRTALELLLSDHAGDCIAPCQLGCPARMDIPAMIRHIADDNLTQAIATIKHDIPLPATLGRICPAPCESVCRRAQADSPIAICHLKKYAADADLASPNPYTPTIAPPSNKNIAIVGTGPTGLSAAYFLLTRGHACTLFDSAPIPGGALRHSIPSDRLPPEILDAEINIIKKMGASFQLNTSLGSDLKLTDLAHNFDAAIIAIGPIVPNSDLTQSLNLDTTKQGIAIDKSTYATNIKSVFAAGAALRPTKLAIRSIAQAHAVSICVDQFLNNKHIAAPTTPFTTKLGKLTPTQLQSFTAQASPAPRTTSTSLTSPDARAEAQRCLHCDCSAITVCKLRHYAITHNASPRHFTGDIGRVIELHTEHPNVIFEPGKCISCGICVQIAKQYNEQLGRTFIGRGFDVYVDVPFESAIDKGLVLAAIQCAQACPTGAITSRDDAINS